MDKEKLSQIELPTVGEILRNEFMEPHGISACRLAKGIHVPLYKIQEILNNNRKINLDMSIRLGKYFDVSYEYFIGIQNTIDVKKITENMSYDIESISPLK